MLTIQGVSPISDSVVIYCSEKSVRKAAGLWAFVTSFRAEKKAKAKEQVSKEMPSESGDASAARPCESSASSGAQPGRSVATQREIIESENLSADTIKEIGFHPDDIIRALELAPFSLMRRCCFYCTGSTRITSSNTLKPAFEGTFAKL